MRSRFLIELPSLALVVVAHTFITHRAQAAPSPQVEECWEIVPSPNGGPQAAGNNLLDVVAISPTDAWAVGTEPNQSEYLPRPLAIHWDGVQWSIVETPTIDVIDVRFNAVAAVASDDVWAVGYSYDYDCGLCAQTLIEHWDGTAWSIVPSPNPGWANLLYGVAALSADDVWTVGYRWNNWSTWEPLILHYDGKDWTSFDQSQHEFGQLHSVFAVAADDVWAVGVTGVSSTGITAFALHWDGTSWTRVAFPSEGDGYIALYDVSGVASDDVWAVGVYKYVNYNGHTESLARSFHWDGSRWTRVSPGVGGRDSRVTGVHAVASDDVWAAGAGDVFGDLSFRYVTLHWDGVSWSYVESPEQGLLNTVAASSSSDVWAVGWGMDDLAYSTGTYTIHRTACDNLATLTEFFVVFGSLISGGLQDLVESDDSRVRVRSHFGFSANEPHIIDVRVGAVTSVQNPALLDLAVEGRINQPGGTSRLRLRNWNTNTFQQVHQYAIGTTEIVATVENIDATNYVRSADGRIEASIRPSVFVVFSAQGFESFTDHVEIALH